MEQYLVYTQFTANIIGIVTLLAIYYQLAHSKNTSALKDKKLQASISSKQLNDYLKLKIRCFNTTGKFKEHIKKSQTLEDKLLDEEKRSIDRLLLSCKHELVPQQIRRTHPNLLNQWREGFAAVVQNSLAHSSFHTTVQ